MPNLLYTKTVSITIHGLVVFAVQVLNEFGSNCRSENDDWGDYVSEEDIKKWLMGKLTEEDKNADRI